MEQAAADVTAAAVVADFVTCIPSRRTVALSGANCRRRMQIREEPVGGECATNGGADVACNCNAIQSLVTARQ